MAAAYFALRAGAVVIGLDTVESRRALPGKSGSRSSWTRPTTTRWPTSRAATGGRGATVVVEASGSAGGRLAALGAAALGGRVVLVGFGDTDNVVDLQASVIQKQLDVLGAWMFPLPDLQEMLYDISLRGISIKPLITGTYGIDDPPRPGALSTKVGRAKP